MTSPNVLFTSAGRRVALVQLFRQAMERLALAGRLVTADLQPTAPARFAADIHDLVPPVTDPAYVDRLVAICERHQIGLVVPLIDTELHLLAARHEAFDAIGAKVLLSPLETVEIGRDKRRTDAFFAVHGIMRPRLLDAEAVLAGRHDYPVMIKPAFGSASEGVYRVKDDAELSYHLARIHTPIVQEIVEGDEYTLDILADFQGRVRSVVPRRRLQTRAGEISKGVTVKDARLIEAGRQVVETLPGVVGPITVQCFITGVGEIVFFEINPRFGGGFPLSARAGADFPGWILQWLRGDDPEIAINGWQHGLYMLRYDEAIFVTEDELR